MLATELSQRATALYIVQLHSSCFTNSSSRDGNLKKNIYIYIHPMNKEIPS